MPSRPLYLLRVFRQESQFFLPQQELHASFYRSDRNPVEMCVPDNSSGQLPTTFALLRLLSRCRACNRQSWLATPEFSMMAGGVRVPLAPAALLLEIAPLLS